MDLSTGGKTPHVPQTIPQAHVHTTQVTLLPRGYQPQAAHQHLPARPPLAPPPAHQSLPVPTNYTPVSYGLRPPGPRLPGQRPPGLHNLNLSGGGLVTQPPNSSGSINTTFQVATSPGVPGSPQMISMTPASLGGATLISQPLQVLHAGTYQQVMSTMQGARFAGGAVLMPFQQGLLAPGALQRAQLITAHNLPKNIQPKPTTFTSTNNLTPSSVTTPNVTTMPAGVVTTTVNAAGLAQVSSVSFPITSFNTTMATGLQPQYTGGPITVSMPQVLNVPKVNVSMGIRPMGFSQQIRPLMSPPPQPGTVLQSPQGPSPISPGMVMVGQPQVLQLSQITDLNANKGMISTVVPASISSSVVSQPSPVVTTEPPQKVQIPRVSPAKTPTVKEKATPTKAKTPLKEQSVSPAVTPQRSHKKALKIKEMTAPVPSVNVVVVEEKPVMPIEKIENTVQENSTEVVSPASEDVDIKEVATKEDSEVKEEPVSQIKDEPVSHLREVQQNIQYNEDNVPVEYEDVEFIWEEYMEETGTAATPPTAFTHVEFSLESGLMKGMLVEVCHDSDADRWWVASIVMTCGQLLRLRYEGALDANADFWCDNAGSSSTCQHVGWCTENNKTLLPPEVVSDKIEDTDKFLTTLLESDKKHAPAYLLDGRTGSAPVDQLSSGLRLEIQHELDPQYVWLGRILENVGGRLLLRYEGAPSADHDFWLFYLHHRVHPIGWAETKGYTYSAPGGVTPENPDEPKEMLKEALEEAMSQQLPCEIFKDQEEIKPHQFQEGWKLEAIHPKIPSQICPATIAAVIDSYYFLVEVDAEEEGERCRMCCHGNSRNIFPVHWCMQKGLRLAPPPGWSKEEFDWAEYLKDCNATPAPEHLFNQIFPELEFEAGQKLEAVNPSQPGQVCAATINHVVHGLLWIHLDCAPRIMPSHIVSFTSQEIFPVGWCESNNYPLKPPRRYGFRKKALGKQVAVVQPEPADGGMTADEFRSATYSQIKTGDGNNTWCPKIYFNHRCFSGPYLSKGRIAELPKCVGPGPIPLVMKEVLTMLINVAYKSSRVLRELQMDDDLEDGYTQQILKAKYKGKSYRAVVEICKTTQQVQEFCRTTCIKLECCPNLFSPYLVNGHCPENCHQLTKTKYTYYYGKKKKKKIGRPPGGHTNLEDGPKRIAKRRKRRGFHLFGRRKAASLDGDDNGYRDVFDDDKSTCSTVSNKPGSLDGSSEKSEVDPDYKPLRKKRKYTHHLPPPSFIKTRGAKLPKFSFERRTHKKIMLASPPHCNTPVQSAINCKPQPVYRMENVMKLETNPLMWTVNEVIEFMKTTDCAHLVRLFKDQEIDGQALLLLTLPTVQEHLELKLGPAIKLCHIIEKVKIAFYEQFAFKQ